MTTHPRPWHAGSLFTAGPRRPLTISDRALWLARLHRALADQALAGKEYLVGRALLRLLGQEGRLDPAQDTLATIAACSRRTAQRALERLRDLGLVRWTRRLVRRGWRAEQASNAYELVPGAACERQPDAEPRIIGKGGWCPRAAKTGGNARKPAVELMEGLVPRAEALAALAEVRRRREALLQAPSRTVSPDPWRPRR